jgi:dipeptidyl-peptidase-4
MTSKQLTLQDVAHYPRPGMNAPNQVMFTPDSQKISYLYGKNGSLTQELWTYDLASGERKQLTDMTGGTISHSDQFSLDEELRRERSRQRGLGITSYQFAQAPQAGSLVLLIPFDGQLYLSLDTSNLTPLPGIEGAIDPQLSPDGSHVAFVRNGELNVLTTDGIGQPRILTSGAGDGLTNGLAEYIAQEEMGRHKGFWWSPGGKYLAFVRADSRHIPKYSITHQGTEHVFVEEHRYPFAGARNAIVHLGIVSIEGNPTEITWMDLGEDEDIYLARVVWRPDGILTALIQSRDQRSQKLVAFNPLSGSANILIEEQGTPWLNLNDELCFLHSGEFVWSSERSGFNHLYLYDQDGHEIRMLTGGE